MKKEELQKQYDENKIDPMYRIAEKIAQGIAGGDFIYCVEENCFYVYEAGYWKKIYEYELIKQITLHLTDFKKLSLAMRKQAIENVKTIKDIRVDKFNTQEILNLNNGILTPKEYSFIEHDPSYYSTMRLPYEYNKEATCPLWIKTLEEIFEGSKEKLDILQEFTGYCLTRDTKYHKALLLLGESRCLGGETLIYDPVKDKSIPVSEIKEDFHVQCWDGEKIITAKANKPFTKEVDDLYEVTLSNCGKFVCSKSHLILTSSGYVPLGSLHEGDEVFLPQTKLNIVSIIYRRKDVKYDFTVPIYHNYICGGAVHHNSGKSTILSIIRNMLGEQNCSSVPLKYIANPQYTPMLINKLVNIDTDVSAKAVEFEAEFKTITSGEPLHCNQKFIAAFDFIPFCKLIMAANIFPKITDHSSAFYNRLILIPCDRVFSPSEQNRELPMQLRKELPGILNWAIEGLNSLTNRGHFKEYDFMREAVEELENENNPVNLFFEEHVNVNFGAEVEKGFLFNKYKIWADASKNFILSKARFGSCVYKRYHKETPKSTSNPETFKRVWKNLEYVESKNRETKNYGWQE